MLRIAIQPLVAMLSAGGAEATVHVARAVTSLSRAEPNRDALRDAGAPPSSPPLLHHSLHTKLLSPRLPRHHFRPALRQHRHLQHRAAGGVGGGAAAANWWRRVENGGIGALPRMAELLLHDEEAVQQAAVRCAARL